MGIQGSQSVYKARAQDLWLLYGAFPLGAFSGDPQSVVSYLTKKKIASGASTLSFSGSGGGGAFC